MNLIFLFSSCCAEEGKKEKRKKERRRSLQEIAAEFGKEFLAMTDHEASVMSIEERVEISLESDFSAEFMLSSVEVVEMTGSEFGM